MTPDMHKIRSAAGRQLAYLNAFSTLTRFPTDPLFPLSPQIYAKHN